MRVWVDWWWWNFAWRKHRPKRKKPGCCLSSDGATLCSKANENWVNTVFWTKHSTSLNCAKLKEDALRSLGAIHTCSHWLCSVAAAQLSSWANDRWTSFRCRFQIAVADPGVSFSLHHCIFRISPTYGGVVPQTSYRSFAHEPQWGTSIPRLPDEKGIR